jgi:hypothetical protein
LDDKKNATALYWWWVMMWKYEMILWPAKEVDKSGASNLALGEFSRGGFHKSCAHDVKR